MSSRADTPDPREGAPADPAGRVSLRVSGGRLHVDAPSPDAGPAQLSWDAAEVRVTLDGRVLEEDTSCEVGPASDVQLAPICTAPSTTCELEIARDRMHAMATIVMEEGVERTMEDAVAAPGQHLRLRTTAVAIPADAIGHASVAAAIQTAGVVHGVEQGAVDAVLAAPPGTEVCVATGTPPVEGRNGSLEPLIDFETQRCSGVTEGTPLLRLVRKRDGTPGRDVTGREISAGAVKEVRLRPGQGVRLDDQGILAIAAVDGSPRLRENGLVEVQHQLVLDVVDISTGDIDFTGTVLVRGDVGDARTVRARDEIIVEGNVDRATLDSGNSMQIHGSIMSSVLRVGGVRAVAVTIADRILGLPRQLAMVGSQARQLTEAAKARGNDQLPFALTLTVMLEERERGLLASIQSIAADLEAAGPDHADTCARARRWYRLLSTAAIKRITTEHFQAIIVEVSALADDVRHALEEPANLTVSYMQASEAEATGTVTISGKGIFNSRIVAGAGVITEHPDSVLRGGSIVSHGNVEVPEIGSPAGVATDVWLARTATLEAALAYAGTAVHGPSYTHRFITDRTHVKVGVDGEGQMGVESLAA